MTTSHRLTLFAAATLLGACGGTDNTGGGATCTPGTAATVTITATGVSPKATCVLPTTGMVTFRNNDTVAHTLVDLGTTCPQISAVGSIAGGGGTGVTTTFPAAVVCQYRAGAVGDAAFEGTVAVTTGTVGGPGY